MPASSSSEIPSGLGTSTQMPGYLSGTKVDLDKFDIKIKYNIPVIPDNWWQTLTTDDKAIRNMLEKQLEGKDVNELKGIYKNLSGLTHKTANVGAKTLIKYITYIRMIAKDY